MTWIHVYSADLGALSARACYSLLDESEKQRASAIVERNARCEFVKTRAILRLVLSGYAGASASALPLGYGRFGKPMLLGNSQVHFNVSHSAGVALVAISSSEVGVDIEHVAAGTDLLGAAQSVFSRSEVDLLVTTPVPQQADVFFSIWTRKEAYLKATGRGFSSQLGEISALSPGGLIEDETSERTWYVLDVPAPAGFKAAVVSSSRSKMGVVDITDMARSAIKAQAPHLPRRAH